MPMATGAFDHSALPETTGYSIFSKNNTMRAHDLHEKEKQIVSAIRAPLQRAANPFLITDRQNEKQLCVSSRNLGLNDFVLMKTLGTG